MNDEEYEGPRKRTADKARSLIQKHDTPKRYLQAIILISSAYIGGAAIGLDFPRPWFLSEHVAYAGNIKDTNVYLIRHNIQTITLKIMTIRLEIQKAKESGKPTDAFEIMKSVEEQELNKAESELKRVLKR